MKLSRKTRYALGALVALARAPADQAVQVRQLAAQEGVPARFLEQIFQDLRRAGLVTGRRGPKGGFRLRRAAERISLLDVVRALEGPVRLRAAEQDLEAAEASPNAEAVANGLRAAEERLEAALASPSLAELADEADRLARRRAVPRSYTYAI